MSTYLVYMDRATAVQDVQLELRQFVAKERDAQFVLLRPTSQADNVITFDTSALPVIDTVIGDAVPRKAIAKEISDGHRAYAGILLAARDRWKLPDTMMTNQLERRFHMPVTCVCPSDVTGTQAGAAWPVVATMGALSS